MKYAEIDYGNKAKLLRNSYFDLFDLSMCFSCRQITLLVNQQNNIMIKSHFCPYSDFILNRHVHVALTFISDILQLNKFIVLRFILGAFVTY